MPQGLKETPLHDLHVELGARMVDFAGWHMPVQYQGALKEHLAVRQHVGLFDVSHMGEIEVTGPDALRAVQHLTCNNLNRISDGQAQYSAFLTPQGTFVDDIVVYRISSEHIFICVNAANREKDFQWVQDNMQGQARAVDRGDDYAQIAIQGSKAEAVLQQLTPADLSSIRFYAFEFGSVCNVDCLISRTGYTGEKGFEIYTPPHEAERIWRRLMQEGNQAGIVPAGLAARNTLRLEVCFALYGNDIDDTITPLEAGLGWICKLDQEDFIGRQTLIDQKEQGVTRKLSAFEMVGRGIARDHFPVYLGQDKVAEVTSGSHAPSLGKAVGLTYLPASSCRPGQEIEIEIRGKRIQAQVVKKPFYSRK